MQISKMSKSALVLLTLLTSFSAHANWYKFSCDSESQRSEYGDVYNSVQGSFNPQTLLLGNVTLEQKKPRAGGSDMSFGLVQVDTLRPINQTQEGFEYRFEARVAGRDHQVKITFENDAATGYAYRISINGDNVKWCTPLHK